MNEDFLPRIYQKTISNVSIEEYQFPFFKAIVYEINGIQWIIDFIKKSLTEIDCSAKNNMNEKEIDKLKDYKQQKEEQLGVICLCELNIKRDTNTLLNAIAGSVNHKWDDYNLTEIVGFEVKETKFLKKIFLFRFNHSFMS